MGSTTSSITVPTFTGSSTFASSFQQVLTKAVSLASLPIQEIQVTVNSLTNQQSALTSLQSSFQSLDSALQAVGAAASGSYSATSSAPTEASATATSSALPGTYSIQVDSPGAYSTAMSGAGSPVVTDPTTQSISSATSFTLTVNGTTTTITNAGGSLEGLANAINNSSAGAQATIVNLGSNSSPNYQLVVTSTSLNNDPVELSDSSGDLLGATSEGSQASYQVNGSSTKLYSDSPQVTLAPGLTVTMLGTSSTPATITVSADSNTLQSALSTFADAYNSTFSAVQQQTGQNGGALAGQDIVYTMQNALESLIQYSSGSGSVGSLNDLGLSVDKTGVMTFDASTFSAQSAANITEFLGSVTTGGFMQNATNALSNVDDSATGDIQSESTTLQSEITTDNTQISDKTSQLTIMETNLEQELTQADATIADLQEQKSYYTELFQAEYPSSTS
jgi:flagellar hook-associated protein 2